MADGTESAGLKALRYAEDELGVHVVLEETLEEVKKLDELLTELSSLRDRKRDLEARRVDKELLIASDEWGKHPDMAAARMEKHVKIAYSNDDEIRGYREEIIKVTGDIEGLEFDKEILETTIKIGIARMNELGGYLAYLAAVKNAQSKP